MFVCCDLLECSFLHNSFTTPSCSAMHVSYSLISSNQHTLFLQVSLKKICNLQNKKLDRAKRIHFACMKNTKLLTWNVKRGCKLFALHWQELCAVKLQRHKWWNERESQGKQEGLNKKKFPWESCGIFGIAQCKYVCSFFCRCWQIRKRGRANVNSRLNAAFFLESEMYCIELY